MTYAATGSAVAAIIAPVAPTRLASVYVEDPVGIARRLGLKPTQAGANVVLLQPEDEAVLQQAEDHQSLRCAALALVAGDLLSGPGRAPVEAEALMDWMAAHGGHWRG